MKLRAVLRAVTPAAMQVQPAPVGAALAKGTREGISLDDSQLLTAMRQGDAAAANAVCLRLAPRVRGTVRRLLGPADQDGDDVVQKSLFDIVQHVDGFRGDSSLETWAAAVTARVVYKHIRRRRLERRVFDSTSAGESDLETAPHVGPVDLRDRLDARSDLAQVFALLSTLDEEKVFPYLLHDVCGFDLREIAEITQTSVAAAQSRLVRGRRIVHETMRQNPHLEPGGTSHE